MKFNIDKKDVIMSGQNILFELEVGLNDITDDVDIMDMEKRLQLLRDKPKLAAELLSYEGRIIYMGVQKEGLGMHYVKGSTAEVEGENVYGLFLEKLRDAYRNELSLQNDIVETPVEPSRIVVDFVPSGAFESDIETREREGESFIHTEPYSPVKFHFDANLSGTTGHAERRTAADVPFHTFVCPFGVTSKYKIKVDSAAEASLLYEKALRKELDWDALFTDLKSRGNIKGLTVHQEDDLKNDLRSQFLWMREEICRDDRYSGMTIVADSLLVPDTSFGRSIYDPELAPCPAHILARYIENPFLLYCNSQNGVVKALETVDKEEPQRLSQVTGNGSITLVVDGSDTIGGREPNTRSVARSVNVYSTDKNGNKVIKKQVRREFQFKSDAEIEADYASFSERMDTILKNVSPELKVRFVSGTTIGTPRLLKRYVTEHGGQVFSWDYSNEKKHLSPDAANSKSDPDSRFSLVMMPGFRDVFPVFAGGMSSVDFSLNPDIEDSEVSFSAKDGISPDAFITFSVSQDVSFNNSLSRGSLAIAQGYPLIHVQENRTEEEQNLILESDCSLFRSTVIGEMSFNDSLFEGKVKDSWDLSKCHIFSSYSNGGKIAIPFIADSFGAASYVNGVPFHSIYGAYAALLLKGVNVKDQTVFQALASVEGSMTEVSLYIDNFVKDKADDMLKERCMRNAVHMMSHASSDFSERLLSTGDAPLALVSTVGDPTLFVGLDGKGQNRFGTVLEYERTLLHNDMEIARKNALAEGQRIISESARLKRIDQKQRAEGQKVATGLPGSLADARDAVWLLGTSEPLELCLPPDLQSFELWEEGYNGEDVLNREKASRVMLSDTEGNNIPNRYVFLFPSNLSSVLLHRRVNNDPDKRDLTDLTRTNPQTGEKFNCAFGIPVKRNSLSYEVDNPQGMPCSFLLDNDSSLFLSSIIATDALARSTAYEQGMALSYAARISRDGTEKDRLSSFFGPKAWDFEREVKITDRKTGRVVSEDDVRKALDLTDKKIFDLMNDQKAKDNYWFKITDKLKDIVVKDKILDMGKRHGNVNSVYQNADVQTHKRGWVPNRHASASNLFIVKRYESVLREGSFYPLNCIKLPLKDYTNGVSAEKFMSDFSFVLSLANATAIAMGVPMRFPLSKDGHLDLGPGVPENFCRMAESKLDSFIGVVKDEDVINGPLPFIKKVPIEEVMHKSIHLQKDSSELFIRPNDLLQAFGRFDFRFVTVGSLSPMHEMSFIDGDGVCYKITDPRMSSRLSESDCKKYESYEKNDVCRFTIKSSDPSKIPSFIVALRSYIERAKDIQVESRIVAQNEESVSEESLEGFVHLFSSNSDDAIYDEHDLKAREDESAIDVPNRLDGTINDSEYYGKEDAHDAFSGYAQFRYILPDGTQSDWTIIKDLELAKDIILSSVGRKYRSDTRVLPSSFVLESSLKSLAVSDAGDKFLNLKTSKKTVVVDDKVVNVTPVASNEVTPSTVPVSLPKETYDGKVNIFAGKNENAVLSNFAKRPFKYDVSNFNKSNLIKM